MQTPELDPSNQNSVGADQYGFNPFPGRYPNIDFYPGPLTAWKPYFTNVEIVCNYANQLFQGTRDRTALNALANAGIGGARS